MGGGNSASTTYVNMYVLACTTSCTLRVEKQSQEEGSASEFGWKSIYKNAVKARDLLHAEAPNFTADDSNQKYTEEEEFPFNCVDCGVGC